MATIDNENANLAELQETVTAVGVKVDELKASPGNEAAVQAVADGIKAENDRLRSIIA